MSTSGSVTFEEVLNYPYWRHRIDLGDGRVTPGTKPATDWNRLDLPADLDGKSVLDVGAFDGLLAFEAERRGADEVLAIDVWSAGGEEEWWYGREPRRAGFDLVREYLDSDVRGRTLDVYDLSTDTVGQFDLVICSKVLPFLPEPYTALSNLVSVATDRVVVESATPKHDFGAYPVLELARETTANPNRWWHPQPACLDALLLEAGCSSVDHDLVPNSVSAADLREGIVPSETPAFRTFDLDSRVDFVPADTPVTVLYEHGAALKIEYRPRLSEPYRQAWVHTGTVSSPSVRSTVNRHLTRLREISREEGITVLPRKIASFLHSHIGEEDRNVLAVGKV